MFMRTNTRILKAITKNKTEKINYDPHLAIWFKNREDGRGSAIKEKGLNAFDGEDMRKLVKEWK